MKTLMQLTLIVVMGLAAGTAHAELLAYEGFDYTGTAINGQTGGGSTGFSAAWDDSDGDVLLSNDGVSLAPSASTLPVIGSRLSVKKIGGTGDRRAQRNVSNAFDFDQEGQMYMSVLMRKNSLNQPSGETVNLYGGGDRFRVAIGSNDQFFAVLGGSGIKYDDMTVTAGDTYFAVAKLISHGGSTPDEMFLKIYAPDDIVDIVDPASWDVERSAVVTGQVGYIRVGFGPNADAGIDEIRYGDTWADVAPIPEPNSLILLAIGAALATLAIRRRGR